MPTTFFSQDTEYSADAVEFSPMPVQLDREQKDDGDDVGVNLVAVGTYQVLKEQDLTQTTTQRSGRLLFYSLSSQPTPPSLGNIQV